MAMLPIRQSTGLLGAPYQAKIRSRVVRMTHDWVLSLLPEGTVSILEQYNTKREYCQ